MLNKKLRCAWILALAAGSVFAGRVFGQTTRPDSSSTATPELKLYCVGYAHLDTQWRWSYPQVISEFLRNTLHDNFRLFEKYPHYIFNFTGANRYMMFKEYYPKDYQKLKEYVAAGRWFPGGSSMEEGDVNMPDGEAIIRQVLYGNEFFRKEFGKQSCEFMLPDCFGFQASLPSLLAHCGLRGFSTQKLTWGSAVGIPFNVGIWEGPDGGSIVAALNPGSYNGTIESDLSHDSQWRQRIEQDGKKSGFYADYRYYGSGDRGGAPRETSLQWLETSIAANGPVKVISSTSEQMFLDLTPEQIAKLPRYKGDLLLTNHSAGSLTSQAFIKRLNRKNEELADAAERASVAADWLGSATYPMAKLNSAWRLLLGAHFHDTMAGTALPKADEYSWNNLVLAMNQFAAVAQDGVGAVTAGMDTRSQGVPLVVYNPLSIDREDIVEARVAIPGESQGPVSVFGPDGKPVPTQVASRNGNEVKILFRAHVPSVGFAVFDVRQSSPAEMSSDLRVNEQSLENARYRLTLNAAGDIASIYDKTTKREVLSAPARLAFLYQKPELYPAWNMDWVDRSRPPRAYVDGPCKVKVIENGPVRVALEVEREAQGSRFIQQIRLASGSAGDRIEVVSKIDWQARESSLEAVFPLAATNPLATYESQSAAIQRGNNDARKFEVPQQQWLDLTDSSNAFGTAVLNDSKYGSDKPDDHTIRLTLLYTPGVRGDYQDQATQDIGRHEMIYALSPHAGDWRKAGVPWEAQELNQPLLVFQTTNHDGGLGKTFSLCRVNTDHVTITAMKKAEDSDEIIVRLHELNGQSANGVQLSFAQPIVSAREIDGQEREIGPARIVDGHVSLDMTPFQLRAFAVKMATPASTLAGPVSKPVPLAFDLDAVSTHENLADGSFDGDGHTYPAESLPDKIVSEGIEFTIGPKTDGAKNTLTCRGQTIALPAGDFNHVYLLASAVGGDVQGTFDIDGRPQSRTIQNWTGYIGQWDNRLWQGVVPGLTYSWNNKLSGLAPGFIKPATVAWFSSHRHDPQNGNEYYRYAYLFKYGLDLPVGAKSLMLPNDDRIRIFAVTVAKDSHDDVTPSRPLYDTLEDHVPSEAPVIHPSTGKFNDATWVSIDHPLYWQKGGLHYTTDGSEPTINSPVYESPIIVVKATTVRAREIDNVDDRPTIASAEATATINVDDITAPTVTSASGVASSAAINIAFSEPVRKDQAETIPNYHLQPALDVQSAKLSEDGMHVVLTVAKLPMDANRYLLTITGVGDLSPRGNMIAALPVTVKIDRPVFSLESFTASGKSNDQKVSSLPTRAIDPWTINFFVKTDKQPENLTILAGFGRNSDADPDGLGRYLCVFPRGIHFWSRHADVDSTAKFDLHRWQMLTATFDGHMLRLFKDGRPIGDREITLVDDEPIVRLAPSDPWEDRRRFAGEIRDFTIWKSALSADEIGSVWNGTSLGK
jgi:alpha-mannosidase